MNFFLSAGPERIFSIKTCQLFFTLARQARRVFSSMAEVSCRASRYAEEHPCTVQASNRPLVLGLCHLTFVVLLGLAKSLKCNAAWNVNRPEDI